MQPTMQELRALKTLGMRCLVLSSEGQAFATAEMMELNEAGDGWRHIHHAPDANGLFPKQFDHYSDDWRASLIDLNNPQYDEVKSYN